MSKDKPTPPDDVERERASDVPDKAELRADGSYLTAAKDLTDEEKAALLPASEPDADILAREEGAQSELPREQGTDVSGGAQ